MKRGNARGAKGAGHLHRDRKGQRTTGGTRWCRWKAVAFNGWHEPCESRGSSTVLGAPRGEIPRGDSARRIRRNVHDDRTSRGAALQAQALAQGVSVAGFTRHVLEQAIQPRAGQKLKPKKSAYGLLAKCGPGRQMKKSTKTAGRCFAASPRMSRDRRCR